MSEIIAELQQIAENVQTAFGHLSAEQINWKPSETGWSVGQCFEHLIKINSEYFPEFENIIKGARKNRFWENYSPLNGFFGNLMIKSLSPQARRKLKAPKAAEPSASDVSPGVIEDFVKHQAKLIDQIRQTKNLDTKKIILTSPFIKVITYSLFDTFRILVTHEKRHFGQAERVAEMADFPK
jgi:hypothetical protein